MTTRELKAAIDLEARTAALFVQNANRFACKITLSRGDVIVNCKSIMGIISISIREGQSLTLSATGPEENDAVETLALMLGQLQN